MGWAWITLRRSIFGEEALLEVSNVARLVYVGLHVVADEHGRFRAGPRSIGNAIGVQGEDVAALLAELEGQRLFIPYEVDGARYGIIRGYDARLTSQQRHRRPAPEHPAPSAEALEAAQADPETSRSVMTRHDTSRSVMTRHDPSRLDKTRQEKTRGEDLSAPEGAHTHEGPKPETVGRRSSRTFDEFDPAARLSARAWCDEMEIRRRRCGGAVSAKFTALDALQDHGADLLAMAESDDGAFAGAVETMLDAGRGFGRGGPRDGIPYLRTIFSGWHAEQEGTTRAKRRKKEGPDFVRVGPPPTPGPVEWTLIEDNELADVL